MAKEIVVAVRDIKKGEPLNQIVKREAGFFYFVENDGSMKRAPFARKSLTPEQRAVKEQYDVAQRLGVAQRKEERLRKKAAIAIELQSQRESKARVRAAKKESQVRLARARLESRILSLEAKKQNL